MHVRSGIGTLRPLWALSRMFANQPTHSKPSTGATGARSRRWAGGQTFAASRISLERPVRPRRRQCRVGTPPHRAVDRTISARLPMFPRASSPRTLGWPRAAPHFSRPASPRAASTQVIDPDRRVDEDHQLGERRRGASTSEGSLPPKACEPERASASGAWQEASDGARSGGHASTSAPHANHQ